MNLENLYKPKFLTLQWHITERCNLKCKHCYQDKLVRKELKIDILSEILEQYVYFLRVWNIKGHINVTGGEPFIRKDFFELLEKFSNYRNLFSFSILTNGLFINKEVSKRLKSVGVKAVQLSIEGMEKTNDLIRGKGTFKKIIKAAQILIKSKIPVSFAFTCHKLNYKDFPEVVRLAQKIGVNYVGIDRLLPLGKGLQMKRWVLDPLELKDFYQSVVRMSETLEKERTNTYISVHRPLFFLIKRNKEGFICPAGRVAITIMCNGDVFPCRRMPIRVGNVLQKSLFEIWNTSSFLKKLRNPPSNEICIKCPYFKRCQGGARCQSYAYFKNPFAPDPQCWVAFKKLPRKRQFAEIT